MFLLVYLLVSLTSTTLSFSFQCVRSHSQNKSFISHVLVTYHRNEIRFQQKALLRNLHKLYYHVE